MTITSLTRLNEAVLKTSSFRILQTVHRRFTSQPEGPPREVPKLTITPLEIAGLPVLKFKGRVMIIDTPEEDAQAAVAFEKETLLGFDSETKPSLVPGVTNKTAIIQIASAAVCGVWRVRQLDALPPTLTKLLADPTITKASQGATSEVATVYREFSGIKCQGFVDLHLLAMGLRCNPRSLQGLCALFLHKRLLKAERISNWEQIPLSPSQLEYAATDAWVSRQVLKAMRAAFCVEKLSFERPINPDDLGLVPRTPASINQPLRIPFKNSPYVGSQAAATSSTSPSKAGVKALATLCVERAYVLTVESFEPAMGGFRCSLKVNLRHEGRPHVLQCRSAEVHTSIRAAQDDAADVMLAAIGQLTGEVSEGQTAATASAGTSASRRRALEWSKAIRMVAWRVGSGRVVPICMEEPAAASPSSSLLLRILGALAAYQNRLSEELAKVELEYERDPPRAICTATRISLQQRRVANRMRLIGNRYIASLAALERTFPPPVVPAFTQQPTSPARGVGATSLPLTMQLPLGAEEQSRPSRSSSSEGMLCGTPSPSRSVESSTASSASSEMSLQQHTPEQLRFTSPVAVTRQSTPSSGSSRKSSHKKCEVPECTRLARGVGPQARRCASHGGGRRCFCGRVARGSSSYCGTHGGGRRCQQEGCASGAAGASNFCVTHGGGRRCSVAECPKASCAKSDRCFEHGGGRRCSYEGCSRGAVGLTEYCIRHGGGKRCGFEGCTKGAVSGGFCVRHGNQVNGTPSRGLQGTPDADTPPGSAVISPATSLGSSYGEVMASGSLEWTGSSQVAVLPRNGM